MAGLVLLVGSVSVEGSWNTITTGQALLVSGVDESEMMVLAW